MAARLTSAFFISSVIRRVNGAGGFAAVLRRGSDEAGAIFLCVREPVTGNVTLYGQAPQSLLADGGRPYAGGRLFEVLGKDLSQQDLEARLDKEARLDPDFWAVELEMSGLELDEIVDVAKTD